MPAALPPSPAVPAHGVTIKVILIDTDISADPNLSALLELGTGRFHNRQQRRFVDSHGATSTLLTQVASTKSCKRGVRVGIQITVLSGHRATSTGEFPDSVETPLLRGSWFQSLLSDEDEPLFRAPQGHC